VDRELAGSLGTLHKSLASALLDQLELDAEAIARRMASAAREEVDEYASVADPAFAGEVLAHAAEHVNAFVRAARRGRPPEGEELDFVRTRGAQRARELMPLDALLEAYLIGQRTVWEAIVEAAGETPEGMRAGRELTGLTFAYTHAINVAVADAYMRESMALASEAERGRRDLLDRLLSGRAPGADEARRAEALGLRPEADHAVVVAAADGPDTEKVAGLVVRTLTRVDPGRPFVVARHEEVVAVLPVYVRRGPAELRAALDRAATTLDRTHQVRLRAGVSSVCSGLSELGRGYGEASRALRQVGDGAAVVALQDLSLLDYLASEADETARRLVPAGARRLAEEDRHGAGTLAATLRAYADCDMNVMRAAERLTVHPNTVHYRLRRVAEVSGRDPRRFEDLAELLTALRLLDRD
jgi:PucR C-terminal helix-turn-helix domain/GGDEF-like domain